MGKGVKDIFMGQSDKGKQYFNLGLINSLVSHPREK